tara:strand:+ start:189 stop:410 length:222 start_codon:yes stop_codon:yes gene_type:complete
MKAFAPSFERGVILACGDDGYGWLLNSEREYLERGWEGPGIGVQQGKKGAAPFFKRFLPVRFSGECKKSSETV